MKFSLPRPRTAAFLLSISLVLIVLTGCTTVVDAGLQLVYEPVELSEENVYRDLPYWPGSDYDPRKHRLDLFVPETGPGWPVLVFVHGGGWNHGDKDLRIGEEQVYSNIGRHYAKRGIGVAVINYRLLPEVTWPDQVRDVARAVAWVHRRIGDYGGNPRRLFLSGHSAGAQLSSWVALDGTYLAELGLTPRIIRGVIGVSGVGYDMVDPKTYELGVDIDYLIPRFRLDQDDQSWQRSASPIFHVSAEAPPFLLLYGDREWAWLHRQNELLAEALEQAGSTAETQQIEGERHRMMVLALSHPAKTVGDLIEDFIAHPPGSSSSAQRTAD